MPRGVSPYEEARLQGQLWTPALMRPALAMWFDAQDASTISATTSITQWRDKSGYGRHATGSSPIYTQQGSPLLGRGRPIVRFPGSTAGAALRLASLGSPGWTSIDAIYLMRVDEDPPTSSGGSNNGGLLGEFGSGGEAEPFPDGNVLHAFGAVVRQSFNPTPSLAQPHILGIRSAANDWRYFIDGAVEFSTGTNTVQIGNGGQTPSLGLRPGDGASWAGRAAEIVIWVNTSAAEAAYWRKLLEAYLAWHWDAFENLSADSPFKNRPPLIGD